MGKDWVEWHRKYDDPRSSLARRLEVVRAQVATALAARPPGPIRVVSACAGEGRDLIDVVASHSRRDDITARLVELDERLATRARARAERAGLHQFQVVCGDASATSAYEGAVPADLVMVCGVFGNISDDHVRTTVGLLPSLSAPAATVVWTRFPRDGEVLGQISRWFSDAGFAEVALETGTGDRSFGVGVHRLVRAPAPFAAGAEMFNFQTDPDPTALPR